MGDKALEMTMLFDFFGDLLTDKQKEYFDLYYNDDLSLSEIAESTGISRQGVRDNIVRAENSLREFEAKTGVVKRFEEMQQNISKIEDDLRALASKLKNDDRDMAEEIISKLQDLKG